MVKIRMLRFLKNFLLRKNIKETIPRIAVYPYLSGDAFLALADVCVLRDFSKPIYLRRKKPKIVFIETGLLRNLKMDSLFESAKVVIIHNGDEPLSENEISFLRKNNLAVYATNSSFENGFIEPIPIGIENAHYHRNGSLNYYNPLHLAQLNLTKKNDIFVSFSVRTNPIERNRILAVCQSNGILNEINSITKYRQRLSESKFIISPPGNGIDCHRTWEAMYHKTIPVVEDQFNFFKHIDLPVLSVPSIKDFFALTKIERDSLYEKIIEGRNYPAIYFDYWQQKIINSIYT
jgi:hypothetical protein